LASKLVGVEEILDRVAPLEEETQATTEEVPASEE
jgi:hypothetical protein